MNRAELVAVIAKDLRLPISEVNSIARSAPFRYRTYTIPKRTGGVREINHPAASLKIVQRWLVDRLLNVLPVHDSATAYVGGRSILQNAELHQRSNYFVRYDFRDFFSSISDVVIGRYIRRQIAEGHFPHELDVVPFIVRLVCHAPVRGASKRLSIGAPSSPHVSNMVMFPFDEAVSIAARNYRLVYSRYADDIYISGHAGADLERFDAILRQLLGREASFAIINEEKVQWMSRKGRVSITGLNVSSQRKISVGRELKRSIRTRVYLAIMGRLDLDDLARLRGHISYLHGVEPEFVDSLKRKYPSFFAL